MNRTFKNHKFRFLGIAAILAFAAFFSLAVMLLWNAIMPNVFELQPLSYWQAAGLLILVRVLFGGFGLGHFWSHGRRGGFHHGNPMRERWMSMTDDERKEFMRSHRNFPRFHDFFNEQSEGSEKSVPDGEGDKREQSHD